MTREEAKEFAPILQAFAEGKVIESRTDPSVLKKKDTPNEWTEMKEIEYWNNTEYRIKPKSKYRPFKGTQECWDEMLKHQPFGWIFDNSYNYKNHIGRVSNTGITFRTQEAASFEVVFDNFKFADGTPFGIKMEE